MVGGVAHGAAGSAYSQTSRRTCPGTAGAVRYPPSSRISSESGQGGGLGAADRGLVQVGVEGGGEERHGVAGRVHHGVQGQPPVVRAARGGHPRHVLFGDGPAAEHRVAEVDGRVPDTALPLVQCMPSRCASRPSHDGQRRPGAVRTTSRKRSTLPGSGVWPSRIGSRTTRSPARSGSASCRAVRSSRRVVLRARS